MFVELMPLLADRAVMITASRLDDATIRVNVVPRQLKDGENAALTTPLCITGTPEELDAGLPEVLAGFVTGHGSLRTALQEAADAMAAAAKEAKESAAKKAEVRKSAARPVTTPPAGNTNATSAVTPVAREKAAATGSPAATSAPRARSAATTRATTRSTRTSEPAASRAEKPTKVSQVPTTVRRSPTSARKAVAKRKTAVKGTTHATKPAAVQAELPIAAPTSTTTTVSGLGALVSVAEVSTFTTTLDRLHQEGGLTKEAIAAQLGFQHASSLYKSLRRKRVTRKVYDAMQSLAAATFGATTATASSAGGQS